MEKEWIHGSKSIVRWGWGGVEGSAVEDEWMVGWLMYPSSIAQVSLGYPSCVIIFLFFFNSKISRYVRDTYREVSGQYPVSEQYPIPVRQKSKVSALHSRRAASSQRRSPGRELHQAPSTVVLEASSSSYPPPLAGTRAP
jgi:hypothetical protein